MGSRQWWSVGMSQARYGSTPMTKTSRTLCRHQGGSLQPLRPRGQSISLPYRTPRCGILWRGRWLQPPIWQLTCQSPHPWGAKPMADSAPYPQQLQSRLYCKTFHAPASCTPGRRAHPLRDRAEDGGLSTPKAAIHTISTKREPGACVVVVRIFE